ncbi:MAG: choice-of-anchor V domain-containing protein [Saprospiraceae bacterium]
MRIILFSAFFLSVILALNFSTSRGVTDGFDGTGSPLATSACRNCHTGNSLGTEASIQLKDVNGVFQTSYIAEQQYSVELSYSTTVAASGFGIQAVILDDNNSQAGTIGVPPTDTRVRVLRGREYIDHLQRLEGNSLTFDWTAPVAGTGEVSIYAVINAVNGDGLAYGDTPNETSISIDETIASPQYLPRDLASLRGVDATSGIPDSIGILVEVEGFVYGPDSELDMSNFNILNNDGTAGVAVLNFSDSLNYDATEGQRIIVRGAVSQVVGITFIEAVEIEVLSSGSQIADEILVDRLDESLEGRFVRMEDLQPVDPNLWQANPTATYDFPFKTPLGDTIIAQIAIGMPVFMMGVNTFGEFGFDISGVVRQFDTEDPFFDGYYILPRYNRDLREIVVSTKEVNDFELNVTRFGESLTVEAPSSIQSISLVDLDGRILQTYEIGGGQQRISLTTPSSATPLQVLWVQLSDGRKKAVFVR